MSDIRPQATLVITTRNRKEELRGALQSALTQTVPLEIMVIDDDSDDGTVDLVRHEFPSVILVPQPKRVGLIVLRNIGAKLVTTPYIFSIDDDAIFTTPCVVEQTLQEFTNPRVGAVAIPYSDVRISKEVRQRAPTSDGIYATDRFIGTAHAIRRDIFLKIGGYRDFFIHQGEEGDLCARMLDQGYITKLGTADLVHHFVSPKRDMRRMHYFGMRNNVLGMWLVVPTLCLPAHFVVSMTKSAIHAVRVKAFGIKCYAMIAGIAVSLRHWRDRRPISLRTYKLVRMLRRRPRLLTEIESQLPPLKASDGLPSQ